MSNKNGKHIDKTFLSIDQAEARGFIHRDYIAHCFRWSHVVKQISKGQLYKRARILDIGCGKLMPMGTMLHSSRMAPQYYCGVEYGAVDRANKSVATTLKSAAFQCDIWDNTDVRTMELDDDETPFNVIVCFEMLEHVEPKMVLETLKVMRNMSSDDAVFYISTPCYNGKAAANHVNEMTFEALAAVFESQGFCIESANGTFASIRDYQHLLSEHERWVFDRLSGYYDVNVLSTIFAPLHPEYSRNCLWTLRKDNIFEPKKFDPLSECRSPWSSSELWRELDG